MDEKELTAKIIAYVIIGIIILAILLIPTWIAIGRKAKNRIWIFLFNFLLGGLIITWVAALIWAIADKKEVKKID
ncbi:MAG: superinfection immunity protein [Crocinitomicaceae bacterium]|nr:superinfection immunity protein [Crocinitomicaceae bacterium]